MSKKQHKMQLVKRTDHKPYYNANWEMFYPTTLIYGVKEDPGEAFNLIIKTGQKGIQLPKGDLFDIIVSVDNKKALEGLKKQKAEALKKAERRFE